MYGDCILTIIVFVIWNFFIDYCGNYEDSHGTRHMNGNDLITNLMTSQENK